MGERMMGNPADGPLPGAFTPLGWALIHFLWQGAALAALAAIAMRLCRQSSLRYLVGVTFLGLMLAAPIVTLVVGPPAGFVPIMVPTAPAEFLPGLVQAWAFGVALLVSRFGGGLLALEWRCRNGTSAICPRLLALCREAEQRLGITRAVRYLECHWLEAPAGFGALRPVILFPVSVLTGLDEDQLRAVIAHELAHVRRWDFAVNLFQVMAETLLFYHPAIWWLNRRIRGARNLL